MAPPAAAAAAPPASSSEGESRIPTASEAVAGQVWAASSSKRDKLAELVVAAAAVSDTERVGKGALEDLAEPQQRADLWLAAGLKAIAAETDSRKVTVGEGSEDAWEVVDWLNDYTTRQRTELDPSQWEDYLTVVSNHLRRLLSSSVPPLQDVREFFIDTVADEDETEQTQATPTEEAKELDAQAKAQFERAVLRFRVLLARAAADTLLESTKKLTTLPDQDTDRAAVSGVTFTGHIETLPRDNLLAVLQTHLTGACQDRIEALWKLMDRDDDGLLDKTEMEQVAELTVVPVRKALAELMQEALEKPSAWASPEQWLSSDAVPTGWRQRRREKKHKKRLIKTFQKTLKSHFEVELEMPHRLRCIYAWANKAHQNNKVDSVLVDNAGHAAAVDAENKDQTEKGSWLTGRKRYVELHPKIALSEFREVQKEHLLHLDGVATEYLNSFRDDLLVQQGKGRENQELLRDCAAFFTVVCVIDYLVTTL